MYSVPQDEAIAYHFAYCQCGWKWLDKDQTPHLKTLNLKTRFVSRMIPSLNLVLCAFKLIWQYIYFCVNKIQVQKDILLERIHGYFGQLASSWLSVTSPQSCYLNTDTKPLN